MYSLEQMKAIYRNIREIAKTEDNSRAQEVIDGVSVFSKYFKAQYPQLPLLKQYYCKIRYESFDAVIEIIKYYGLQDKRVKAFFGFIQATPDAPSFGQVNEGKGKIDKPKVSGQARYGSDGQSGLDDLFATEDDPWASYKKKSKKKKGSGNDDSSTPAAPDSSTDDAPVLPVNEGVEQKPIPARGNGDPQSLSEFIGQEHVVKRIIAEIKAAKKQGLKHIDNILLFGNRGLGKSTLMELIAKELGVKYEFIDASGFSRTSSAQDSFNKFLQRISMANEPVVIAVDEIHALPENIQTGLLTLLNSRKYSYLDKNGQTHVLPVNEFTFIGATTDSDKILSTIKDRCSNLTFYLKDYTPEELRQIFINKFGFKGLTASEEVIKECIQRCRCSIREVKSIVDGLNTKAINADTDTVSLEMVQEYFQERELDSIGLGHTDIAILKAIASEPSGVISADTLAARVHLDVNVLTKDFEPYLIKIGFISINSRGRSLTEKAIKHLKGTEDSDTAEENAPQAPDDLSETTEDPSTDDNAPTDDGDNS